MKYKYFFNQIFYRNSVPNFSPQIASYVYITLFAQKIKQTLFEFLLWYSFVLYLFLLTTLVVQKIWICQALRINRSRLVQTQIVNHQRQKLLQIYFIVCAKCDTDKTLIFLVILIIYQNKQITNDCIICITLFAQTIKQFFSPQIASYVYITLFAQKIKQIFSPQIASCVTYAINATALLCLDSYLEAIFQFQFLTYVQWILLFFFW
eukprot:TRINITY_DN19083_c0_g1_i8.p3 TRINITY_DN19083_c0_g1~~TRINITY_DN19083_c0_g1_i8.p3  ORF type:complete len:207 (-),score=-25.75 TRINITY_DN19083_c0_g1_i8:771-1391(-)